MNKKQRDNLKLGLSLLAICGIWMAWGWFGILIALMIFTTVSMFVGGSKSENISYYRACRRRGRGF